MLWCCVCTCAPAVVDRYGARLLGFLPVLQVFSFTVTAHETFVVRAPSARDPGGIRVWRVSMRCAACAAWRESRPAMTGSRNALGVLMTRLAEHRRAG